MRSYQQFFAELKRRHVFKVATIYGVMAFGILQVAEPLGTALGLSDSFLSLIVGLLLLGFPVALVLAWAFEVTPEGVQKAGPAAPGEIAEIMAQPASKRWPAGLLALAGAGLLFGGWWIGGQTSDTGEAVQANLISGLQLVDLSEDPRPSIAVLPFADMSSTQDQEYFGDGMSEAILNVLARAGDMRVSGRTSAFAYKGENKDLREIGTELGVEYIVEGSVAKEGDQVRVTAQLITAEDGSHLWSDQYLRPLTSIFEIQSEISVEIADALKVPLGLDDASSFVTPTSDLEAYDLYLAGRARLRARAEGVFEAIELFKAAIARDSTWAPAWAGLADATELSASWRGFSEDSIPFDETLLEAEAAARRALELDARNSTALVALGSIHRDRREWSAAEDFYRRALALDPDNAEAHQQFGEWLYDQGRLAEAVRSYDRAVILDPAPIRVQWLALVLLMDLRLDEAREVLEWATRRGITDQLETLAEIVAFAPAIFAWYEGRYEEFTALPFGTGELTVEDTIGGGAMGRALRAGRLDLVPDSFVGKLTASELIVLNEPELAVEAFLEAEQSKLPLESAWAIWEPDFDPIRSHPRIQEHMESLGLAGHTLQRTPVDQRVRPAILRRMDAEAAAESAEESGP